MHFITRSARLSLALRIASAAVLAAALVVWFGTGAHRGWTQTSRVVVQHDEITGIDYPIREKTFVAGIEFPAAGLAASALLAAAGLLVNRRRRLAAG